MSGFLEHNHVTGLLVIKRGEVVVERYTQGNTPETKWYSFSVAKSVVSLLIGAALRDGYIQSLDAAVTDYLPILAGSAYEGVTIRHALQMASGVEWNEDYADPASDVASVNVGDPPALPGRHPEFDSSGIRMGKLPRVSRSSITQGSPHDELSQSKPLEMGLSVSRRVHPEVPEEGDLRRAAPVLGRSAAAVSPAARE